MKQQSKEDIRLITFKDGSKRHVKIEPGADLQGADLHYANLRDANLRNANLQHSNLLRADLRHANLQGTKLDKDHSLKTLLTMYKNGDTYYLKYMIEALRMADFNWQELNAIEKSMNS